MFSLSIFNSVYLKRGWALRVRFRGNGPERLRFRGMLFGRRGPGFKKSCLAKRGWVLGVWRNQFRGDKVKKCAAAHLAWRLSRPVDIRRRLSLSCHQRWQPLVSFLRNKNVSSGPGGLLPFTGNVWTPDNSGPLGLVWLRRSHDHCARKWPKRSCGSVIHALSNTILRKSNIFWQCILGDLGIYLVAITSKRMMSC